MARWRKSLHNANQATSIKHQHTINTRDIAETKLLFLTGIDFKNHHIRSQTGAETCTGSYGVFVNLAPHGLSNPNRPDNPSL